MASTIWLGNIEFGGMTIPVKLHSAVSQNRIQFHLLHKTDRVRLVQQMVCKFDKAPVPAQEQVKGFQVDERKYIVMDAEELEAAQPASGRAIAVQEFVKNRQIDPVFIEHRYYLESDANDKSYGVLAAAMDELDVQGICTWVMRKREYFGSIESAGKTLRLNVLRYADEIIAAASLGLESFEVSEKELRIGGELIDKLTVAFQPEKYIDEHQIKLRQMIDKKAHGSKIALLTPKNLKPTTSGKLLEALEKSLRSAA